MDRNKFNEIIFSLIWGIGISVLFKKVCKNGECVLIKVPKKHIIENRIFIDYKSGKCYKFQKYNVLDCYN